MEDRARIAAGARVADEIQQRDEVALGIERSDAKHTHPFSTVTSFTDFRGIMRADKQIKLTPERSVLKLNVGDPIKLTEEDFERLSAAFFVELKRRSR